MKMKGYETKLSIQQVGNRIVSSRGCANQYVVDNRLINNNINQWFQCNVNLRVHLKLLHSHCPVTAKGLPYNELLPTFRGQSSFAVGLVKFLTRKNR